MSIVKYLSKKQISRQLFRICRLNKLETRSEIEAYFREHGDFRGLQGCSPEDLLELESFMQADLLRLEFRYDLPRDLLRSASIVQLADLLLQKELFPERQMLVLKESLHIYNDKPARSLMDLATAMGTSEKRLSFGRTFAINGLLKVLRLLPGLREDLLQRYELDPLSDLIRIDEAVARRINAKEATNFSPQFLSLLFGLHLGQQYVLLGIPAEALAGNYMGNRHYWSDLYLLKKELAEQTDLEGLLQEAFRLLYNEEGARSQNLRNFVSYFSRRAAPLERLLPVAAEILHRELGLRADREGKLEFPLQELPFRRYCYEALEAIGEPVRQEEIRQKMAEMQPEAFMDHKGFTSVMLDKYGFTNYQQAYFGLQEWYPETNGNLREQDPEFLEGLKQKYSKGRYRARRWQALMDFVNTHSRLPRSGNTEEEDRLWHFWNSQQNRAKKGPYYREHQAQMDELERRFVNKKYKPNLDWDERYARAKAFTAERGIPPQRAASGEEKVLHNWLRSQRRRMKEGKLEQRQEILIKHYDELYPYKTKKYFDQIWNQRYKELERFLQKHSRAPRRKGEEESLERWYTHQRVLMGRGELSRRQHLQIQAVVDRFPLKDLDYRKDRWHDRCSEVEAFAEAHSHLPRFLVKEEKALNQWVSRQTLLGIRGKLDFGQMARLQKLFDHYETPSENGKHFYERFSELKEFATANSRLPRHDVPEEKSLYLWAWMQLKRARSGELDSPKREQLLEFCAPYRQLKPNWNDRFREVKAFAETHLRLPKDTPEEKLLFHWLRGQKARLKKGSLPQREENLINYLLTRYRKK